MLDNRRISIAKAINSGHYACLFVTTEQIWSFVPELPTFENPETKARPLLQTGQATGKKKFKPRQLELVGNT